MLRVICAVFLGILLSGCSVTRMNVKSDSQKYVQAIDEAIGPHKEDLKPCFDEAISDNDETLIRDDKITVGFVVLESGLASQVKIRNAGFERPALEGCLTRQLSMVKFPLALDSNPQASFTLAFKPYLLRKYQSRRKK